MTEPDATMDKPCSTEPAALESVASLDSAATLASILDRYMADLRAGIAPDRDAPNRRPSRAGRAARCMFGGDRVYPQCDQIPRRKHRLNLGEFRIIREVGRGGMGVVYEAEQTSLRRHVAPQRCYGSAWWPTKTR